MRITVEIDPVLWKTAEDLTDIHDPADLIRYVLEREVRTRSAANYLTSLGGTMPDFELPPRKRPGTELP